MGTSPPSRDAYDRRASLGGLGEFRPGRLSSGSFWCARRRNAILEEFDLHDPPTRFDVLAKRRTRRLFDPVFEHALTDLHERRDATLDPFMNPDEVLSEGRFDWPDPMLGLRIGHPIREDGPESRDDSIRCRPAQPMTGQKRITEGDAGVGLDLAGSQSHEQRTRIGPGRIASLVPREVDMRKV